MELWIRSQDKQTLAKIEYVYLEVNEGREILGGNNYMINKWLGTYTTKKRALEVLDEIENLIYTSFEVSNTTYEQADIEVKSSILCNISKIYDMPEY